MKKVILSVIIILCLIPVLTQATETKNQEEILFNVLENIEGEYVEGDISANGLLIEKFLNVQELDNLGREVVKSIGMEGKELEKKSDNIDKQNYIKEVIDDEGYKQINYFGYDKNNNPLTIILSSYFTQDQTKGETYLYINLIKREHFLENNDIIEKINNLFTEYDKNVEFTTCLIGSFSGKFNEQQIDEKCKNAIEQLNGKIVDIYKDEQLLSYTAYTDYLEQNILAGEDRINLNIALRYNEYDNETLIWIGTPIITSGY